MKPHIILNYLLLATIISLPFSSVRFLVLGVPIYMPELMVIFTSVMFAYTKWHTDTFRIQNLPRSIFVPITMIIVGVFLSSVFNGITTVQLGIIKSWFLFPMLFAWLVFQTMHMRTDAKIGTAADAKQRHTPDCLCDQSKAIPNNTKEFAQKVLFTWYTTLVATASVALIYFLQGHLTYDGRLAAWYLSPNYLALFLFPGVLLGWYFISKSSVLLCFDRKDIRSMLYFATALLSWVILLAALYLTLSYTVITASILGFFTALFLTSNHSFFSRITIIALCISFISFFLLFQIHGQKFSDLVHLNERSSLVSRMMIWQASQKMIAAHPIVGIGPGNFQSTYLAYQSYFPPYLEWAVPHPHNLYLAFWLQTGIIGLIGFILLCFFWIRNVLRAVIFDTKKASLLWTLFGILIALLLIGFLDMPYFKTDLAYVFWLLVALGL